MGNSEATFASIRDDLEREKEAKRCAESECANLWILVDNLEKEKNPSVFLKTSLWLCDFLFMTIRM